MRAALFERAGLDAARAKRGETAEGDEPQLLLQWVEEEKAAKNRGLAVRRDSEWVVATANAS